MSGSPIGDSAMSHSSSGSSSGSPIGEWQGQDVRVGRVAGSGRRDSIVRVTTLANR